MSSLSPSLKSFIASGPKLKSKIFPLKGKQKLVFFLGLACWILCLNLWILTHYDNSLDYFVNFESDDDSVSIDYDEDEPENNWTFESESSNNKEYKPVNTSILNDVLIQALQRQLDIYDERNIEPIFSTNYETIANNHDQKILSLFANLNFNERCDLYFENLYSVDHNWSLNPNEDLPLQDRWQFRFNGWRKEHFEELKKKFIEEKKMKSEEFEETQQFSEFVQENYKKFWSHMLKTEQKLQDYLTHLRIFNKCYITNDTPESIKTQSDFIALQKELVKNDLKIDKNFEKIPKFVKSKGEQSVRSSSFHDCSDIEQRVYPWLSFHYPIYERWNGEVLMSPPILNEKSALSKNIKAAPANKSPYSPIKSKFTNNQPCFLNRFKNTANGRGLVLTIHDGHAEDTVNLIRLLRALNNRLPIQIVYFNSISAETKKKIVKAAREKFFDLPKSFESVAHLFPDDYLHPKDGGLPKQEIWFVNVNNVIHDNYRNKFRGWGNKFLATIFNSFEEFMLIDSDTALVKPPSFFFDLPGYKETGTYFYKDRTTNDFRPDSDVIFFKKIAPSVMDSLMFNIPQVTSFTLNNHVFSGLKHQMEAGLVIINRSKHMGSMLMMPQLHFAEPVRLRSHGDKELFWLAFSVNGDENYFYNDNNAAAIGIIDSTRSKPDGTEYESTEICSPHPGHVNGYDDTLDWFNSGFHFCGRYKAVDYPQDFKDRMETLSYIQSVDEMRAFYYNALQIEYAAIPPYTNRNEMELPNDFGEPIKGWVKHQEICHGYQYCAFDSIGGGDNIHKGKLIKFDDTSRLLFQYYGDIWVGNE